MRPCVPTNTAKFFDWDITHQASGRRGYATVIVLWRAATVAAVIAVDWDWFEVFWGCGSGGSVEPMMWPC